MNKPAEAAKKAKQIIEALEGWQKKFAEKGKIIDANIPFRFLDRQIHTVDVGWVKQEEWKKVEEEQNNGYPSLAPKFIVKFSGPDYQILESMKAEMAQLRDYGCPLGWLVEPTNEHVFIYKPNQPVHQIPTFDYYLDGREVLDGFEFPLKRLRY